MLHNQVWMTSTEKIVGCKVIAWLAWHVACRACDHPTSIKASFHTSHDCAGCMDVIINDVVCLVTLHVFHFRLVVLGFWSPRTTLVENVYVLGWLCRRGEWPDRISACTSIQVCSSPKGDTEVCCTIWAVHLWYISNTYTCMCMCI